MLIPRNFTPCASLLREEFTRRSTRSLIAVVRDLLRQTTLAVERPTKKRFGGSDVSASAEPVDGFSGLVDDAVEIRPTTLDLDVVSSTRQELTNWRARRFHRFSNSGM